MKISVIFALGALTSAKAQSCDFANDVCPIEYQFDGECDADGNICAFDTDCYDCDKCKAHHFDCTGRIEEGCVW